MVQMLQALSTAVSKHNPSNNNCSMHWAPTLLAPVHTHAACERPPAPNHSSMLGGHPTPAPPQAQAPATCKQVAENRVQRTGKLLCMYGLREQIKAISNTPKPKRLKKLCLGDYKNLS